MQVPVVDQMDSLEDVKPINNRHVQKRISVAQISPVPVRQSVAVRKRVSLGSTILKNSHFKDKL